MLGLKGSNQDAFSMERPNLFPLPQGPSSASLSNVVISAGDKNTSERFLGGSRKIVHPAPVSGQFKTEDGVLPHLVTVKSLGSSQQVSIQKQTNKMAKNRVNSGSLNSRQPLINAHHNQML